MRTIIWVIVALLIGGGLVLELRYEFSVAPPVVAKFDRLTGNAWIANAGVWRRVSFSEEEVCVKTDIAPQASEKVKQAKPKK